MNNQFDMSNPILNVTNLHKSFGSTVAVNDVSFEVQPGEVVGLLGPNGAGKTTTIRMLISVLKPSTGTIVYFGKNLACHRSEILEQVAYASTYTNVPLFLSVLENFRLHALLYGMSSADSKNRIADILAQFNLEAFAHRRVNQISAGQRTRVMLARAFLPNPKIVLLDEPTASLDPEVAHEVRSYLHRQSRNRGVSILFSSHNMTEVAELCDRVIFLNQGRIIAEDSPNALAHSISTTRIECSLGRPEHAASILQKYAEPPDRDIYRLKVAEGDTARVIAELVASGADVRNLKIIPPTLEDFFLQRSRRQEGSP